MDLDKLKKLISNKNITALGLREHSKASEKYVDVEIIHPKDKLKIITSIPYFYRRTGLYLQTEEELASYIEKIYGQLTKNKIDEWISKEDAYWVYECTGRKITKPFFDKLLNLRWNCIHCDLPKNPNWARRIQDIKEMGYTLGTNTKMFCKKCEKNTTHIIILPITRGSATGYETWDAKMKNRIIKTLGAINVYENKKAASINALIPDHKFPEIRWDERTKRENLHEMTDEDIKSNFQLLDNQRNLQKREVCRKCFQTSKRGIIFGIPYFYEGDDNWPRGVPSQGKKAEKGCVGCGWYDIQAWRESAINKLDKKLR